MTRVVFLVGPTAVGKSALAQALAEEDGGAILSLDAMQVYRGLDIGTGKPTAAERARAPHGGLDLIPWWERFDTARYLAEAAAFLKKEAGKPLYVVGGTGLYFRALTQGLSPAPAAPPALREELAALPLETLRERLRRLDPDQPEGFDWNNPRRVQRALEVVEATGKPLRAWQAEQAPPLLPPGNYRAFFLQRERDDLRALIAARVDAMLAAGWAGEAEALLKERGASALRACPALGYGLLASWIEAGSKGKDLPAVRQKIVDETRQYARRQLTWFKREATLESLMIAPGERPSVTVARFRAAA